MDATDHDVIVLGAGIAGSALASVLSKQGLDVGLLDAGMHPRFSLGESMIPGTSYLLRILAARFDVPELANISTFFRQQQHVSSSCGVKRNFGFVHHGGDQRFDPNNSTMLPIPHYPHGPEAHMFRQDVDQYLCAAAIKYGATPHLNTKVATINEHADHIEAVTATGATLRGKFLIDATGAVSPVAAQFGLRETPTRLRTNSSCIFTHMVGVGRFDDTAGDYELPQSLDEGTLHHVFDGGWMWVIPFNNHSSARNPACSIGLHLDQRRGTRFEKATPEETFAHFLTEFPEIAAQFTDARTVRPWFRTPRCQYSSTRLAGDRYCLLGQAAGAVDALFSRGLYITMEAINAIADPLIDAVRTGRSGREVFSSVERITQGVLDCHDRLAHGSYISFRDFELWNAWSRAWAVGGTFSSMRFRQAMNRYKGTGQREHLNATVHHEFVGTPSPDLPEYQELFDTAYSIMLAVENDTVTTAAAIEQLYDLYAKNTSWIPPLYEIENRERHYLSPGDFESTTKSIEWGFTQSPDNVRRLYFDTPMVDLLRGVASMEQQEAERFEELRVDVTYQRHAS